MKQLSIEEIQEVSLEVFKDIDTICRKHKIEYTVIGGTMIGAVRHHGFIPWDDDLDLAMTRDNYSNFLEIYRKEGKYHAFDYKQDKDFFYQFTKITDPNTVLLDDFGRDIEGLGVAVDVFPFDYVSSRNLKFKMNRLGLIQKKINLSLNYASKSKVKTLVKKILRPFAARGTTKQYLEKLDKLAMSENDKQNADLAGFYNICVGKKGLFRKELFEKGNYMDMEFAGMQVMVTKGYDEFLRHTFGDYMKLPPLEERLPHPNRIFWKNT